MSFLARLTNCNLAASRRSQFRTGMVCNRYPIISPVTLLQHVVGCCGAGAPKAPLCKGSCQPNRLTEGLPQYSPAFSPNLMRIRNILPHSPSVTASPCQFAEANPVAALTVHRTVIHYRHCASLTPYTGEPLLRNRHPNSPNLLPRKRYRANTYAVITDYPRAHWGEAPCASNYNLTRYRMDPGSTFFNQRLSFHPGVLVV